MSVYVVQGTPVQAAQVGFVSYEVSTSPFQFSWSTAFENNTNVLAVITEINPTVADITCVLPRANQVSVGMSVIIRNKGAYPITVTDFVGHDSWTIEPGIAVFLYIIDNSTPEGSWGNIVYGAGSSSADANDLAGLGLISLPNLPGINNLNSEYIPRTLDSSYTIVASDRCSVLQCTNGLTITLPSTMLPGFYFVVLNLSDEILRISSNGQSKINDVDQLNMLPTDTAIITVGNDPTLWYAIGWESRQTAPASVGTKDLTGLTSCTLTAQDLSSNILVFQGTTTQDVKVFIRPQNGMWVFQNKTTPTYNVILQMGEAPDSGVGSPITLSSSNALQVYANASFTNIYAVPTLENITYPLTIAQGGTGQTTKIEAFDALSPLTTTGDLIFFDGTHNSRLGLGSEGQVMTVFEGIPSWNSVSGTGTVTSVAVTSSDLTVAGSPITTSGTITLFLNTVSIAKGGTGQTTQQAAFDALSPLTTTGSMIYRNISGHNVELPSGGISIGRSLIVAPDLTPYWGGICPSETDTISANVPTTYSDSQDVLLITYEEADLTPNTLIYATIQGNVMISPYIGSTSSLTNIYLGFKTSSASESTYILLESIPGVASAPAPIRNIPVYYFTSFRSNPGDSFMVWINIDSLNYPVVFNPQLPASATPSTSRLRLSTSLAN